MDVDPVSLVAALLRVDPATPCFLDLASGEVLRTVGECDPEEDARHLDVPDRFVPIRAFTPAEAEAFWGRAAPMRSAAGASGLYVAIAEAGPRREALLAEVWATAESWLLRQGVPARARPPTDG
ncbi:MAG: hypothetical protein OHK0013_23970 [Sandaracinaceae bacterium]